ncbi:four helix bundle protein [Maribacter polysiphoniae]|uniref:four helix bundle protein n=1 Tax=Maribacter polysiphoniae TaxID=429344 RepID=UPI0023571A72|nr:four helix bundle protein [Maribacter polysiphoniae]
MRDYKKYTIWQLGHEITLDIYKLSKDLPKEERYEIISQIKRASYSIPSNIAEGCGRETDKEFKHFLIIARGSTTELEYFLILIRDLKYIDNQTFESLNNKVNKLGKNLTSLINKI